MMNFITSGPLRLYSLRRTFTTFKMRTKMLGWPLPAKSNYGIAVLALFTCALPVVAAPCFGSNPVTVMPPSGSVVATMNLMEVAKPGEGASSLLISHTRAHFLYAGLHPLREMGFQDDSAATKHEMTPAILCTGGRSALRGRTCLGAGFQTCFHLKPTVP